MTVATLGTPVELSNSDIIQRYGLLIESAFQAFKADPTYVVEMVEAGAKARDRRAQRAARVSPE